MTAHLDLLIQSCILVVLPMVPAIVIYKIFPGIAGAAIGQVYGFQWRFGGAFAAYLIVALLLLSSNKHWFSTNSVEVWTVRGAVKTKNLKNISNLLDVKSLPRLSVESDGTYQFRINVETDGDIRTFPTIIFDLTRACRGSRSVRLDGSSGTFAALQSEAPVEVRRSVDSRLIEVAPVVLDAVDGEPCNT